MRRGFILPLFIWGSVVFFPFLLFAGLRTVPQRVGIAPGKPDLMVERIQIVKNAGASELVTDLPFDVLVDIKNVGAGAVPGEQAEVRLKIYTSLHAPSLYESTLRIRISNRTRRARAHFRGIVIRGSELHFSGDFITIGVMAEVDPSDRIEEANERANKMTVLPNLYRAVRNLTLRRAHVEGLRGWLVTLPPEKSLRVRFIVENTGNVMMTRKTVLRTALLKGERGQEVAYESSASPVLRLRPAPDSIKPDVVIPSDNTI